MKTKDSITNKTLDVKLPKTFKTKCLKALRSGKFKQTTGVLHDEIGYCCLGVACKIAHPKLNLGNAEVIELDNSDITKVPDILKGTAHNNKVVNRLATMNDNGKSFKYIASYIEKYL